MDQTLLQDAGAAQLQPLVGKALTTIAQRAARNQQQRVCFLLVDMSGGVTRFVFGESAK